MNLKEQLIERISQNGPLTIADYMAECLLHPVHGYYSTQNPFGSAGDFTTAPEISQMFGELTGLALAQCWLDQGRPSSFVLAELGPGRGTLMADILHATRGIPGFHEAAQIFLVEASAALRKIQAETLAGYAPIWADSIEDLPQAPVFLIANEFFDALPIRQFIRDGDGWRERLIGCENGSLTFGLGQTASQPALQYRLDDTKDGDLVELCSASMPIMATASHRIRDHGGAALIVDYGDWRSLGDTFQAVHSHKATDPLADPGKSDLTAHVDFEALASATRAAGISHTRLATQGVFLERLGITPRAQSLATPVVGDELESLISAHRRLTHPDEMGNLFKVLGLYPAHAAPPPGLEP